jgi:hypothetical protein
METITTSHPFPMIRGGGLFVSLIGLGIVAGAIRGEGQMALPLIAGAVAAVLALSIFRRSLTLPLGVPTRTQVMALVGGILAEFILCGIVAYVFRNQEARLFWLWILLVVGFHLTIIAVAQGPLMLLLGVLCMANAALGLWPSHVPFLLFWLADGILKIIIGGWMFFGQPRWRLF